jgi:hypothetical protein
MRLVVLFFVLTACTVPPEQRAHDVCTAFCDCVEIATPQVDACVADCVPDLGTVSDDCLTCVYSHSQMCGTIFDDCTDMCTSPQPTP